METNERIKYVDMLKCIAILSVIALHVLVIAVDIQVLHHNITRVSAFVRFGVPLFLMVTGMLTLNKDIKLNIFFKKKVMRIIFPLIFFLIIAIITQVYKTPLESFWYCWMIIGTYCCIPVINKYIQNSSLNEIRYFVLFFIISSIFYSIANKFNIINSIDLSFFMGPISYLILGYYLYKKNFKLNSNLIICIAITCFIASSLLKVGTIIELPFTHHQYLYSYLDLGFLQLVQTSSVFIIFKYIYLSKSFIFGKIRQFFENKYINKFIVSVSRSTYGIYMLHLIILRAYIQPYFNTLPMTGTQAVIAVITVTIGLFLGTWIIILLLNKIPIINKFSGYS